MNSLEYFVRLCAEVLGVLAFVWPVTLASALALGSAIVWTVPGTSRADRWLPFSLAIFPLLVLAWGAMARHEDYYSRAPSWPGYVIVTLLALQLIATAVIVYVSRGHRTLATAAGAFAGWCSLASGFVSGMAVTGAWL